MLQDQLEHIDIILASQSPRRQELLKGLDIDFRIETRPIDEIYDNQLEAAEITEFLSKLKAKAFSDDIQEKQLIITSDTIVWLDGKALGKPSNADHAKQMLMTMSNTTHKVYTSVCFTSTKIQETITDITEVSFKEMSAEEIDYYVNNYQPFDRAGAYGIQDWIGFTSIETLKGCYYNVMGLPLPKVYEWLKTNANRI